MSLSPAKSGSWPLRSTLLSLTLLSAQELTPISTHRPTQGINSNLVEPAAIQIESGLEPRVTPTFEPELVLQPRFGLTQSLEVFATIRFLARAKNLSSLSFSPKVKLFQRKRWQLALAGSGHLTTPRGEISALADFFISPKGVLTLNASFSTGFRRAPGYFSTIFYTQSIGTRFFAWVEAFAWWPLEYGAGSGLQYLFGKKQISAMDIAFNWQTGGTLQILIGLSRKGYLFRAPSNRKGS